MKFLSIWLLAVLVLVPTVYAQESVTEFSTCEEYVQNVISSVEGLQFRLEAFTYSDRTVISDLFAFVDRRRRWEDAVPHECAKDIHADVVALFGNIADAGAFAVALRLDYDNSRITYFEDSVARIGAYQSSLTEALSEITGEDINFEVDIAEMFTLILDEINANVY